MRDPIFNKAPPIPENYKDLRNLFGDPKPTINNKGNLISTNKEFKKRIIKIELRIANEKTIHRWVHELIADMLIDICNEVLFYDKDKIKTIGTYNIRYIRNSKSKNLSQHSFGSAIDINASENKMGTIGTLKENSTIVMAFERRGFCWGGRWKGKGCDPMHFEYFWREKGPYQKTKEVV